MSQWRYKTDSGDLGPVSFQELAALVREGKVTDRTQVARAGTMNWEPAWHVPGLFRAAGIVVEGESPVVSVVSGPLSVATQDSALLTPSIENPKSKIQNCLRGLIATVVGILAVGFFYRWAWQTSLAFPMPAKMVDGELIDSYFPVVGRCTTLECGLLYVDVFGVAALATWYAARSRLDHESHE